MNPEKIQKAVDEISESYYQKSILPEILNAKEYDDSDAEKQFIQIVNRIRINKDCFTEPGFDCRAIWNNEGSIIASGELMRLYNAINQNNHIESSELVETDTNEIYNRIVSTAAEINHPDLLLLPTEILSNFEIESLNGESELYKKILYNPISLLLNDLKVRIINSNSFTKIVLMNSKFISWIYKPDLETKKRIIVEIAELDFHNADVTSKTVVSVEIRNLDAVRILE